jgi:hypothetical protein
MKSPVLICFKAGFFYAAYLKKNCNFERLIFIIR